MENTPCTYRISVKAAVENTESRVLLLQERDGTWELPGGGLEHGENVKEALTREITEETGLTVDWISDHPETFWTINKEVGSSTLKWFAFVVYEAKVSGNFHPDLTSDESQDAQYFTRSEAQALQLHDNTKPYFLN